MATQHMSKIFAYALISISFFAYTTTAFSANYLCDVYNVDKKITTLPGALPDYGPIDQSSASSQNDPNIALAYVLCQQAGFQLMSTQVAIPGMRGSTSVTKIQQFPDPKCILKCKPTT